MNLWVAYSYSLYFSDQLSCIKFFHRSYGLKDIEFQSFIQFKSISGFLLLSNSDGFTRLPSNNNSEECPSNKQLGRGL